MPVRSIPLCCVLSTVAAQDLFLAKNGVATQPEISDESPREKFNNTSRLSLEKRNTLIKSHNQIGCGNSCDPGNVFDHWNVQGFNGAISKVCFRVGAPKAIHGLDWITGGMFCYAGQCISEGTGADDCWSLISGEVITEVTGKSCIARGADHEGVNFITIKTSEERSHSWGNRQCNTPTLTLTPPKGKHITAFYGRASPQHAGWGGLFSNIGVYYDVGIARGKWVKIGGGVGVDDPSFTFESCTESETSESHSITTDWSISVTSEIRFGFDFESLSGSRSLSITGSYSRQVVTSTESSFTTTNCETLMQTCKKGLDHGYQFQFLSNFDRRGTFSTKTRQFVCVDREEVCCLPGQFNDPDDATKGCKTGSPNLCQ